MKKIKEQINHIEIIYYKTLHAHKTAKEENLRHLLQLSFHLLDDIWEELDLYLTKEERKHGAKRTEEISKLLETSQNILEVKVIAKKVISHSSYLMSELTKLLKKYESLANRDNTIK